MSGVQGGGLPLRVQVAASARQALIPSRPCSMLLVGYTWRCGFRDYADVFLRCCLWKMKCVPSILVSIFHWSVLQVFSGDGESEGSLTADL